VKLVLSEPESAALSDWIATRADRLASVIAAIEVRRSVRRAEVTRSGAAGEREREMLRTRAEAVLGSVSLVAIDDAIVTDAGALSPPDLRALDAIHLATALRVAELDGLVTYDIRLSDAATARGLNVFHPGR
jgi:predicted nucleic acid-binding protein